MNDFGIRKQIAIGRVLETLGHLQKEYRFVGKTLCDILDSAKQVIASEHE